MIARCLLLLLLMFCLPGVALADQKGLVKQISFFTAVTGILSLLMLLTLTLTALSIYVSSFIPQRTERVREAQRRRPFGAFCLGLINLGFVFIVTAAASEAGSGAAAIPAFGLILMLAIGLSAKGLDIGHRVLLASGYRPTLALSFLSGIPVLLFLCALPFVGWFILLPCFASAGFGGALLSFVLRPIPVLEEAHVAEEVASY